MSRTHEVDVVVVAYNSADGLGECLASAARDPNVGELVVVDHTGRDKRAAVAAGARVLVDPSNPGFGPGQNRGVAATTAPWVLLLNPDARLCRGALAAGLEEMQADPGLAVVQGVIVSADGGIERSAGRELGPWHLVGRAMGLRALLRISLVRSVAQRASAFQDHVDRAPEHPVDVASLAATAILVRRRAFEAIGGFDESYFLYGEDIDLCRRLRNGGWRLRAIPTRWAEHASGASSATKVDRELAWWEGTLQFAQRWWPARDRAIARFASGVMIVRLVILEPSRWRETLRRLVTSSAVSRSRRKAGIGH